MKIDGVCCLSMWFLGQIVMSGRCLANRDSIVRIPTIMKPVSSVCIQHL